MHGQHQAAVVLERQPLTERICEITLGLTDGTPLPAPRAGAHVELRFGGNDGRFLRHYSLVGPLELTSAHEPFWRIAVQRENRRRGSDYIHRHFTPGTPVLMSPALSPFRLTSDDGPVLLIAGGIGVTAILPMLRACVMRRRDVRMLYVGRSRAAMAYVEEVEALGGDAVTVHDATSSRGRPDLKALLARQPAGTTVYVCGPPALIEGTRQAAQQLGWPAERLRHEVFNAAHKEEDQAVTVHIRGTSVHVSPDHTLLEALEAAGVETFSDCRRGECGLCITPVRQVVGDIDHRDRFLTSDQKRSNRQIALCCSRPRSTSIELEL
ncbi:PDR/VanB family oxidoreductase [Modicisalibacter radicis]|uniref:PDR/VanB family oxidoreductase n=1 Tax=Halomonas sp. EAR18 TaxID=2518972 RepID=UPI00109CBC73|nr:PDR/VanB family oxidoreductase [Halomonas sp. EAR18]